MSIEEKQPAGIFIPWDKLLEQINGKLDKIVDKLDTKLDAKAFEEFRTIYERRHENLSNRTRELENERFERQGVKEYKALIFSGGALVAIALILSIVYYATRLFHG